MRRRLALSLLALACLAAAGMPAAAQSKTPEPPAAPAAKPAAASAAATIVNINTASAAEFEALPGIGPKTAARILEYRQKNGPFKKIEELMNVRGLGEKNFLKLKGQLTVGAPKSTDRPDR